MPSHKTQQIPTIATRFDGLPGSGQQLLTDVLSAAPTLGLKKVSRSTFFDDFNRFPVAWLETELRAERQMDGIRKAKERGVKFGKKKKLNLLQIGYICI